jgi:outer membrane protein TolC
MRRLLWIPLAILALPSASHAGPDDAPEMSLGQILQVAVRQSPSLAEATIDVAIADARLAAAAGIEDWLIAASLDFLIRRDESVSGDITATDKVDQIGGDLTLSKLFSTGARAGITLDGTHRTSKFGVAGDDFTQVTTAVAGFVTQPLLRGRGAGITYAAKRRARTALDAAELERRAAARDLVRAVVDGYWELALAYSDLEIRRSSLALAQEQRRITEASARLGQVAQTELTAVDQVIATREEEIIAAELAITERALGLRRLAGLELGARAIDLKPTAPLAAQPTTFDIAAIVEASLATSPEIAAVRARGQGASIDVEVAENGLLPRLDFSLQAGPIGTAEDVSGSLENLTSFTGYTIFGALDLEHPIGRTQAKGEARAAREIRRQIAVTERDLQAQIALSAVTAVRQAEAAAKRMELNARAIQLAETNVEAERQRFELGRATNFDVLQRQEELKAANLRRARAVTDYLRAITFIETLTGSLLERYGINIEEVRGAR